MTLVEDVLSWIQADFAGGFPGDLERVNRDDSNKLDAGIRSRKQDLARSNLVGVGSVRTDPTAVGTEYEHKQDAVLSCRIEGLHENQRGHIADGAAFEALVRNVRLAILTHREYPTTSTPATYHTILLENERNDSKNYRDFYQYSFEIRFRGYDDFS
ncbi:hypothetical protein C5B90_19020 [Haloferax sp. Atlit-12N]|uniref:hypothetical protein n=1 Tax=Haloferax sp. Atlit-12N TaxID=2077203 RepID=UPI000E272CDD|nr:hypothetical protein [Haloferax sp. Atlit-12N]RDZ61367.1 hypothetical protein C5B90_19020 [Haloferax sp. Atlit-12N]